jgi:hypothetical protein
MKAISHFFKLIFVEVFEEFRHPEILSSSGNPVELDYFYPKLKLAIEYQVTMATIET